MRVHGLVLISFAVFAAGLATESYATELSTPPIAATAANTFLSCAVQNASTRVQTVRLQIVAIPGGVVHDSGAVDVAPGSGIAKGALSVIAGPPPACTDGDCPCPNSNVETCAHFTGTAYCRFVVTGAKGHYRAVGCVSAPSYDPVSSPTCVEAR